MKKYHPCSKEFQEEAKMLGLTGNQLVRKYVEEGKLPNPADISREYNKKFAERAGVKSYNDYERNRCHKDIERKRLYTQEWRYNNGIQYPMWDNEDCSHYLGTWVGERLYGRIILPEMFGCIEKEMPYGNPGYDFIVTKDIKIDIKSCCLRKDKNWFGWEPHVRSNIADYFVILMFDDRTNLNLMHVLSIRRDDIIRGYEFYRRDSIKITNTRRGLLEFKTRDWIAKLNCLKDQDNIKKINEVLQCA